MALFHQIVPKDVKESGEARERRGRTLGKIAAPVTLTLGPDICPTCGQRIKPKTDRKAYQREYQKRLRAKKRAEKP